MFASAFLYSWLEIRNWWKKVLPQHVQVRHQIHEPLDIHGHKVDNLAHRALLPGSRGDLQALLVDDGGDRRPELHPHQVQHGRGLRCKQGLSA